MSIIILTDLVETPIGPMLLMVKGDMLIGLEFDDQPDRYMKACRSAMVGWTARPTFSRMILASA